MNILLMGLIIVILMVIVVLMAYAIHRSTDKNTELINNRVYDCIITIEISDEIGNANLLKKEIIEIIKKQHKNLNYNVIINRIDCKK